MNEIANRSINICELFQDHLESIIDENVMKGDFTNLLQYFAKASRCDLTELHKINGEAYRSAAGMAAQWGVSDRYLRKRTGDKIGISPKKILQINRLLHSLDLISLNPFYDYLDLALESGYCDQSHMIEDYQQFIGKTPGSLFG
jgi:AraC-like DNA-binding protein